jgi:phage baseplate assembly protein W
MDSGGRTATATPADHIRHLIEQVLFTAPGERVNRPDFGANVRRFVYEGGGPETMAASQFLVQGELQRWLGDLLDIEAVVVDAQDATLNITVRYVVRATQEVHEAHFQR